MLHSNHSKFYLCSDHLRPYIPFRVLATQLFDRRDRCYLKPQLFLPILIDIFGSSSSISSLLYWCVLVDTNFRHLSSVYDFFFCLAVVLLRWWKICTSKERTQKRILQYRLSSSGIFPHACRVDYLALIFDM